MNTKVSVSYQIDEPQAAVRELLEGLDGFAYQRNSVGLLFCYSDAPLDEIAALLDDALPFPVVGATAIANMDREGGFHDIAVSLTVMSADDCCFSAAVSQPVTAENATAQIEAVCNDAAKGLAGEPKLFFALPPYQLEIMLDVYASTLNRVAPGVPVVGGIPSYNGNGDDSMTVYGRTVSNNRMVVLALGGNVRPVCTVQTTTSRPIERKRKVTRSKDNVIYEVGKLTLVEYLEELGLPVEMLSSGNKTISFVANPLMVEQQGENGETFCYLRTLHELDIKDGSGTAIGGIPQDATISVCPMSRDEIVTAASEGIAKLSEKMKPAQAEGYVYSTVLAVSCIGRHLLMSPNNSAEVEQLRKDFPAGVALSGFYSCGEIGPLPGNKEGTGVMNFAHNESLVLCAF